MLVSLNTYSQKIGEIVDGKLVITEDLSFLKVKWNKILVESNLEGEIDRFEISAGEYLDDDLKTVTYYQITGFTKDNYTKIAGELTVNSESLSLSNANTCTCSGCMYGCHPKKIKKIGWACEPACGGMSECTKSESASD